MSAQIFPIVGATPLVLPDPLPTQDVSDGTPGSAVPATALQVAGSDGTDLRTFLTDANGKLKVDLFGNAGVALDAVLGATAPANALQVGGTDGTNLRALSTDTNGKLKIDFFGNSGVALDAVIGAAAPANTLQVGGKDTSGNAQPFSTDIIGNQAVLGRTQIPIIVQKANGTAASATSVSVAFGSNVRAGNTIVVLSSQGSSSSQAATITDTLKNQYQTATLAAANNIGAQIMFAPILSSGANTVTLTVNNPLALGVEIYEVQGIGVLDFTVANSSSGASSISQAFTVNQENEIAFIVVGAGAQTISASSPASPANITSDSGNLATGGSNLVNFAAFSAVASSPIGSSNANSGNITNTFKITLAGSVANTFAVAVFRPTALQIVGTITPTITAVTLGDGSPNAAVAVPNGTALTGGVGTYITETYPFLFNGTTWDRQRANFDTTTGDTGVKSSTGTGATQTNFNARGAIITALVGAVVGGGTLAFQIQWSPDGGSTWLALGAAATALTTSGNTASFIVYPASNTAQTTGATQTVINNCPLPRTWRIVWTLSGTSMVITAVYVNYIL